MQKLKYALYTGCTAKQSTPEQLKSTLQIAKRLDIELVELTQASCCGACHLQDYNEFLSLVLNARNIAYAEKLDLDIVTICNTCQLNLSKTKQELEGNIRLKTKVNKRLAKIGLEYKGKANISHFLYTILDDVGVEVVGQKVTNPLHSFNIAPFYGCHNIRPSSLQNQTHKNKESPHNPTSLDELIKACGGKNIDYAQKNKCCGFHAELQAPQATHKLTSNAIDGAINAQANALVTSCPLCHLKLDTQQDKTQQIPVFHMQQMVGLALGVSARDLGLDHNLVEFTTLKDK